MKKSALLIIPNLCLAGSFLGEPDIGSLSPLGGRYLNPHIGRWLTTDSAKQYASLYNYGAGNVIEYSDPSGYMMTGGIINEVEHLEQESVAELINTINTIHINGEEVNRELAKADVIMPAKLEHYSPYVSNYTLESMHRAPTRLSEIANSGNLDKITIPVVILDDGEPQFYVDDRGPNLRYGLRPITPGSGEYENMIFGALSDNDDVTLHGTDTCYQELLNSNCLSDTVWRMRNPGEMAPSQVFRRAMLSHIIPGLLWP
ncbi:hypothetical protein BPLS_P6365 [Bathymodiolus platifrons methanotrophic gill symbiont]|uniref:hypothetical protein n=1 Tax=Bathymodiolus platifrons methanotrophic gill symbiont TaxID=113268 RepID=UPI001B43F420|nr:hypothetical protein [Bathymodiolus platifrons methanotrophic gill symbiont]GFO77740.1 hypothetical protein BPLS_P6365 [Bathymodiolus platifrons methanotrophic gill symbiont]